MAAAVRIGNGHKTTAHVIIRVWLGSDVQEARMYEKRCMLFAMFFYTSQ